MNDLAALDAFYRAYAEYFGAEGDRVTPGELEALDRATIAGIHAALAAGSRRAETSEDLAQCEASQSGPKGNAQTTSGGSQ